MCSINLKKINSNDTRKKEEYVREFMCMYTFTDKT